MAFKALFYSVTILNGHGPRKVLCPAQSADDIYNRFPLNQHQKIEKTDHLGWLEVDVAPDDDCYQPAFTVGLVGESFKFEKGSPGYDYLMQQFANRVSSVNAHINEQRSVEL